MPTNKKYTIKTIQELVNLANEKNLDDLVIDLKLWLSFIIYAKKGISPLNKFIKTLGIKIPKKANVMEPITDQFVWTDDGKHDPIFHIIVKK